MKKAFVTLLTFVAVFFCFVTPSYAANTAPLGRDLANLLLPAVQEKLEQGKEWQCIEMLQTEDKYHILLIGRLADDFSELPEEKLYLLISVPQDDWQNADSYLWQLSPGHGAKYGALPVMQSINDDLWVHLWKHGKHVIYMINNQGELWEKTFSNATSLSESGVISYDAEKEAFVLWDGEQEKIFSVKTPLENVRQIAELGRNFYYLDNDGNFYQVSEQGEVLLYNLQDFCDLGERTKMLDSIDKSILFYADNKLWLEVNDWRLQNSYLLCYDGNALNPTTIDAGNIRHLSTNGDGRLNLLWEGYFPVTPNPMPGLPTLVDYTISQDGIKKQITKGYYWEYELSYTDRERNVWHYQLQSEDILFIKQDIEGNAIGYGYKLEQPEIRIVFQGEEYYFDQEPYLKNNRVLLPIRGVAYLFDAQVEWADNAVYLTQGENSIQLNIAQDTALLNGEAISLDAPAEIKAGRTMVPLRFIAEHLSCQVIWDGETKTVEIN